MYQRSVILIFLVLLSVTNVRSQGVTSSLPGIEEVAGKFFSTYEVYQQDSLFSTLEKRKEGWTVALNYFDGARSKVVKRYVFFKRGGKVYESLPLTKRFTPLDGKPEDQVIDVDKRSFQYHAYFGYEGWYKDVINYLEPKKNKTDDELYSLGRAYGEYAGALFSNQVGFADPKDRWQLPFSINSLSNAQIAKFTEMEKKAQQCFKTIMDRSPWFQTFVGSIGLKYANEVMFWFHNLLASANDYAMKIKLPPSLYPADEISKTREMMKSCPEGAILFSFGDLDFYPVLYLQHTEGFRRDIIVVNYSLLGLDRFIYRFTQPVFDAKGISLASDTSMYRDYRNDVLYIEDSSRSVSVDEVLSLLKQPGAGHKERKTLAADSISFNQPVKKDEGVSKLVYLKKTRYLLKSHWILLDMLNQLGNRVVVFPNDFVDELEGLNELLRKRENSWTFQLE